MKLVLAAALCLIASDLPRLTPAVPKVLTPWVESGNRHARRRDRRLYR